MCLRRVLTKTSFSLLALNHSPVLEVARSNGDPVHLWKLPDDEDLGSKVFCLKELTVTKETWLDLLAKAENYKHLTSISLWEVHLVVILRILEEFKITDLVFINHESASDWTKGTIYEVVNEKININSFTECLRANNRDDSESHLQCMKRLTSVTIDEEVITFSTMAYFLRECVNLQELIINQRYYDDPMIMFLKSTTSPFKSESLKILKFRSFTNDASSYREAFEELVRSAPNLEELEIEVTECTLGLLFDQSMLLLLGLKPS